MSDWNLPDISALLKEEIDQQILAEVVLNYCERKLGSWLFLYVKIMLILEYH